MNNEKDPKYLGIPNICFSLTENKREIKYKKQRLKRGFDDSETWSLYTTIASFIVPRLKRFKKVNNGYPANLTEEEWDTILDKMIFSFENCDHDKLFEKEFYDKYEEGINLFAKYFMGLWW